MADSLDALLAPKTVAVVGASSRPGKWGYMMFRKLYASEMVGRVTDRAVQIFGGRGYMRENPVERLARDAGVDRIWEGTSEIQRLIIARGLAKRGVEALTR